MVDCLSNHITDCLVLLLLSLLHFPSLQSLPESINKAVAYLERRLPNLVNPYAVAMSSYALANANKFNRAILYKFVSPGYFTLP